MRYNRIQMRHTAKITCVSESERSSESSKRQGDGCQRVWTLMHMSADDRYAYIPESLMGEWIPQGR